MTRTVMRKMWFTYNKEGIGGLLISANSKQEALRIAREQWGKGAQVEYAGEKTITIVKN